MFKNQDRFVLFRWPLEHKFRLQDRNFVSFRRIIKIFKIFFINYYLFLIHY